MRVVDPIIRNMQKFGTLKDEERIQKAYKFAEKAHENQKRLSGEPYITHPFSVALQLAQLKQDEDTVIAGLLHDVLEDTHVSAREIYQCFGDTVLTLVKGVTNVHYFYDQENQLLEKNLKKFFQSVRFDIRILYIRLIDRLHNMQTLNYYTNEEKQKRKAMETYTIYLPLVDYAGLFSINICINTVILSFKLLLNVRIRLKIKITYTKIA